MKYLGAILIGISLLLFSFSATVYGSNYRNYNLIFLFRYFDQNLDRRVVPAEARSAYQFYVQYRFAEESEQFRQDFVHFHLRQYFVRWDRNHDRMVGFKEYMEQDHTLSEFHRNEGMDLPFLKLLLRQKTKTQEPVRNFIPIDEWMDLS